MESDSSVDDITEHQARFLSWHGTWAPAIVNFASDRPRTLLAIYGVVAVFAIYTGPSVFDKCSTDSSPPWGSLAEKANQKMEEYFADDATSVSALIYIESKFPSASPESPRYSLKDESNPTLKEITAKTQAHFETATSAVPFSCVVQSYYTFMEQHLNSFADEMVSADGSSALISLTHSPGNVDGEKLGQELMKFVDDLRKDPCCQSLWIGAAGNPVIDAESNIAAIEDMASADTMVIPVALAVLAYMLSSPRLLMITIINFITAICLSFTVVYYIASAGLSTNSATPSIMSSVLQAVSIDYSLFMLTRFVEELKTGAQYKKAVEEALMAAGHTVLGSGSTLMLAFMALCFFPIALFVSLALGVVFAVFFAIFVNLTLTPILLLSFPGFFGNVDGCCPGRDTAVREMSAASIDGASPSARQNVPMWYKIAKCTTKPATTAIVCVVTVLAFLLLGPVCADIRQSADVAQVVPRDSDSLVALRKVNTAFGGGVANAYSVLLVPSASSTIFEEGFWAAATDVLTTIPVHFKPSGRNSIMSPMYQFGTSSDELFQALPDQRSQMELWRQCHVSFDQTVPDWWQLPNPAPCTPGPHCCGKTFGNQAAMQQFQLQSEEQVYQMSSQMIAVLQMTTNTAATAVRAQVMADFEMGSNEGIAFANAVRKTFGKTQGGKAESWLAEGDTSNADTLDSIREWAPTICGATTIVILILVGMLYRSAVIPLRGIVTIVMTQIVGFAALTIVYCKGDFSSFGIDAFKGTDGVYFLVLPMTFVIVLGLSLDYDVFLIGRIVEYRKSGFSDIDAIELGVWKTSQIITAAGVIMMIAFSANLLSRMCILNQLGTVLVTAVALDTLFLRAIATPAMMAPLGGMNWWPSKMPPATLDALEHVLEEEALLHKKTTGTRLDDSPDKKLYDAVDPGGDTETGEE